MGGGVLMSAWSCLKCGGNHATHRDIRATGRGLSTFLGFDRTRFTAVTCDSCGATEFHRCVLSGTLRAADLMR